MKKSDRDNSGFHFPINKLNLTNTRNFCIEDLVREHFEKEDYIDIGHENTPIYDLFFHLCFEKFLLKPNWKKWGRNETIKDYPHLIDHLDYPFETKKQYTNPILQEDVKNIKTYREWVWKHFCNVPFEWMFSYECLKGGGNYFLFGEGVYYQIFKEEIDDFIDNQLPKRNLSSLIKENYEKVKVMREEYPTLFIWGGTEDTEPIEIIYENLPLKLVQFILKKQFENFHRYRSGFMDCWMWNEKEKHLKLVEVKRVREKIIEHQVWWLNKFYEYGVDVSVIRVNVI